MRKFLVEMDREVTLDEVRESWREFADGGETFAQYLENCMARNNGALTEILTADTPAGEKRGAVTLCGVYYSENPEDYCEEWLTEQERKFKESCGCTVFCGW